jgi:tRNA pseudouridine38-40 synthase
MSMRNICLLIAYDGIDFHGWQRQPRQPTLQGLLEEHLERITGERAKLNGSGRTDAGVHAAGQVANFRTECPIPCESLHRALNDSLPASVRIRSAREVPGEFHARLDARSKTYRYRILQAPICPPFLARFVHHYPYALDFKEMSRAALLIEGEHDFTSFAGKAQGAKRSENKKGNRSMVRQIYFSRLRLHKNLRLLVYETRGNGFLHHMVRNIVGTLIEVGSGKLPSQAIPSIIEARDRRAAGPTAPAQGLCLVRVEYGDVTLCV